MPHLKTCREHFFLSLAMILNLFNILIYSIYSRSVGNVCETPLLHYCTEREFQSECKHVQKDWLRQFTLQHRKAMNPISSRSVNSTIPVLSFALQHHAFNCEVSFDFDCTCSVCFTFFSYCPCQHALGVSINSYSKSKFNVADAIH